MPRKKFDPKKSEELEAQLGLMMSQLMVQRDQFNDLIRALRQSARRLHAQTQLVIKIEESGGKLSAVAGAYQTIFRLAAYVLATIEEMLPPELLAQMEKTPATPAKPKRQTRKRVITDKPKDGRRKKAAPTPAPSAPEPPVKTPVAKKEKKPPKVKRYGVYPQAAKILAIAFGGGQIPKTLEDVLAAAYGEDWRTQKVGGVLPGGKAVSRTVEDDLNQPVSVLKRNLAASLMNLWMVKEGAPPEKITPQLKKLYDTIVVEAQHTLDLVEQTLKDWGVLAG